jgi:Replicative DNA helicase
MPDSPAAAVYGAMVAVFQSGGSRLSAASIEAALKAVQFDFRWLEEVQRRILPEDTETLIGYAGMINDAANLRRADAIAGQVQTAARKGEQPAETVIADALRSLTAIGDATDGPQTLAALAADLDNTLDAWQAGTMADGQPTGFADLDKIISLRPGELTVLAGRPSMGKSALASNLP